MFSSSPRETSQCDSESTSTTTPGPWTWSSWMEHSCGGLTVYTCAFLWRIKMSAKKKKPLYEMLFKSQRLRTQTFETLVENRLVFITVNIFFKKYNCKKLYFKIEFKMFKAFSFLFGIKSLPGPSFFLFHETVSNILQTCSLECFVWKCSDSKKNYKINCLIIELWMSKIKCLTFGISVLN